MEQSEPSSEAQQNGHMLLRMHIIIAIWRLLRMIVIRLGSFL